MDSALVRFNQRNYFNVRIGVISLVPSKARFRWDLLEVPVVAELLTNINCKMHNEVVYADFQTAARFVHRLQRLYVPRLPNRTRNYDA
jgi:hypothetical protein